MAGYLYNSPLRGKFFLIPLALVMLISVSVRCLAPGTEDVLSVHRPPFSLEGSRNVFLETVKRGENDSFDAPVSVDDDSDESTIILRLFEAYGGHGSVNLKVNRHIPVAKAYATNLLEDHTHELELLQLTEENGGGAIVKLNFRGFEVKTIKLVLGTPAPPPSQKKVSVLFAHIDSGFN